MDATVATLKKLMDVAALRHEALSHNLANVDTAGYRRQDVDFRDALSRAMGTNDPAAISSVEAEVKEDKSALVDGKGNSVSMNREMGALNENSILYSLASQSLNRKYGNLRAAIRGYR